jgi:hypothetical protein
MKLLKAALEKQNYNLAAHILIYGLVKASQADPHNSYPHNYHGKRNSKRQRKG